MPALRRLIETALYVEDAPTAARFYREVLGLEPVGEPDERDAFFWVGDSILILFKADITLQGGELPAHDARGPGHIAFEIAPGEVEEWKQRLTAHGVAIEHDWTDATGTSLYFRDPAGNLLELITESRWHRWHPECKGTETSPSP